MYVGSSAMRRAIPPRFGLSAAMLDAGLNSRLRQALNRYGRMTTLPRARRPFICHPRILDYGAPRKRLGESSLLVMGTVCHSGEWASSAGINYLRRLSAPFWDAAMQLFGLSVLTVLIAANTGEDTGKNDLEK